MLSGNVPMTPNCTNRDLLRLKCLELHAFLLNCCSFAKEYNLAPGTWLFWKSELSVPWSLRSKATDTTCLHQETLGAHRGGSSSWGCVLEGGFLEFGAMVSFGAVDLRSSTCVTIFFVNLLYSAKSVN